MCTSGTFAASVKYVAIVCGVLMTGARVRRERERGERLLVAQHRDRKKQAGGSAAARDRTRRSPEP